ncbi:MAG: phosphoribosylanthranilate isomerase [Planctomycetota bacterium]|nr:phosphoribosylanthranilate isomerase [Planctomycetota bacterium]
MGRTRIKVCGVRDPETAVAAVESGADAIGLVFEPSSPRYVEPEEAWEIASFLPPFVTKVGLLVNPTPEEFMRVKEQCPFDYGQLHGSESEDVVRACGPWIIKAVRFSEATIEAELRRWSEVDEIDALLIDGSAGGMGETFDWSLLARVAHLSDHPLILAGGLTPENVGEAIRVVKPYAVDVSSGVESARGVKDPSRVAAFCEAVRRAER